MTDPVEERLARYIAEYEDAPNWGGPTRYPDPPSIADLKVIQSRIAEVERLALDKTTVDAVLEAVANRSVPTMDPTWSAAWNAAMDYVSKAIVEARTQHRKL